MKTRYKIILIGGIVAVVIPAGIILGPIVFMIAANAYSGFVISSTPDSVFEEEFSQIPEVKFFTEKYPDYSTSHYGDFLGWKIIAYESNDDDGMSIHLEVKKSVLSHKVKMNAGCGRAGLGVTLDVPQAQIMDYLQTNGCLTK